MTKGHDEKSIFGHFKKCQTRRLKHKSQEKNVLDKFDKSTFRLKYEHNCAY